MAIQGATAKGIANRNLEIISIITQKKQIYKIDCRKNFIFEKSLSIRKKTNFIRAFFYIN